MASEAQLETDLTAAKASLDDAITRGTAAIVNAMAAAGPFDSGATRRGGCGSSGDEGRDRRGVSGTCGDGGGEACVKKPKGKAKVKKVMHEFKPRQTSLWLEKGPKVKDRSQAIAIALSEAGKSRKKKKK